MEETMKEDILTCPACRKRTALPLDEKACPRCGLDFRELLNIRETARRISVNALDSLRRGDYAQAYEQSTEAWNLKNDPQSARTAYLACLLSGDLESASSWRTVMAA